MTREPERHAPATGGTGSSLPWSPLIRGNWQLAGGHGAVDQARAIADLHAFAAAGITTFDCADIYTGVEELLGEFRRDWQARGNDPGVLRIHTKCVPDLDTLATLSHDDVALIVDRSRARLGVETLDLVQLHWWDYAVGDYIAAAHHLVTQREEGRLRNIGVTNFGTAELRAILDAGVPVVSHQVQYSLLDRRAAGTMAALCAERGVALLAYGSIAGGFLTERWLGAPPPSEPLENRSLVKYRLIIDEFGGWALFQELLGVLDEIARAHGVHIGTVAIRWALDQPQVGAVIVGARHAGHVADTTAARTLRLTAADHAAIDAVLVRAQGPAGDVYALERDRHGPHGRIMRYNLNAGP